VFNVGGGERVSLRSAMEIIGECAGGELDVRYLETQHGDVRDTGADTARARELLGFDPTTSVREGLVAEFEWMAQRAT
jgi:nucleoside-diphosphate-sugar epimerase